MKAYIIEHPYLAMIVAIAIGMVLARFFLGAGGFDDEYIR